jgi:hypothetical protein
MRFTPLVIFSFTVVVIMLCAPAGGTAIGTGSEEGARGPAHRSLTEMKLRNVLDCMSVGRDLFGRGEFRRAAMEFEKVLELDPTNPVASEYLEKCEKRLTPGL